MDAIVAVDAVGISAAQKATTSIPIVMVGIGDPVRDGFVKSLAHPGGNITGPSSVNSDLAPKLLEMLRSMVPKLARVVALMHPDSSGHTMTLKGVEAAALPENWNASPPLPATMDLGTQWCAEARGVAIKVPSSIVPGEFNYLLNPRHPDFKRIKISTPEPFSFDQRLWK